MPTNKPQSMTFTSPRATLPELLQFANAVREAGGGNPLDALMPAVPLDASQCLIAKNLNFNCEVSSFSEEGPWFMRVSDSLVHDKIVSSLGLTTGPDEEGEGEEVIYLPAEIGRVAQDFDNWNAGIRYTPLGVAVGLYHDVDNATLERLSTFWPYIEESVKEAHANATFVNEKGELVL